MIKVKIDGFNFVDASKIENKQNNEKKKLYLNQR